MLGWTRSPRRPHVGLQFLVIAVLSMALLAGGCGSSQAPTKAAPEVKPAATAPAPAAAPTPPAAPKTQTAAPATPPAGPPIKIKVGRPVHNMHYGVFLLALEKGFFKEEGLDVEGVLFQGAVPNYAALMNGDVELAVDGPYKVFTLIEQDKHDLIMVQSIANTYIHSLLVNKNWADSKGLSKNDPLDKRLKALKGGKFATLSLGGLPHRVAAHMGRVGGLDPEKDMEFVTVQSGPTAINVVKQGTVVGYTAAPPDTLVGEKEGWGTVLVRRPEIPALNQAVSAVVVGRRDWVEKNPEAVRRAVRAMTRATNLLDQDPAAAAAALKDTLKQPQDLLEAGIRELKGTHGNGGKIDQALMDRTAQITREMGFYAKPIKMQEGVDWTNKYHQ